MGYRNGAPDPGRRNWRNNARSQNLTASQSWGAFGEAPIPATPDTSPPPSMSETLAFLGLFLGAALGQFTVAIGWIAAAAAIAAGYGKRSWFSI